MVDTNAMVQKAIAAYKAGKKSTARDILMQVVDLDEENEKGWLYLSLVVDSLEEQEICLDNVLALNPNNEQARKAMAVVAKKLGKEPPPAKPKAPTPPPATQAQPAPGPPSGETSWSDLGAGSSDAGWGDLDLDSMPWAASSAPTAEPAPAASSSDSVTPEMTSDDSFDFGGLDELGSATSVEWGSSGASSSAQASSGDSAFGTDELDSWISGMNIGEDAQQSGGISDAASSVFTGDDWASELGIETAPEPAPSTPLESGAASGGFLGGLGQDDAPGVLDSPFDDLADDPFADAQPSTMLDTATDDEPEWARDSGGLFSLDDDPIDDDDPFANVEEADLGDDSFFDVDALDSAGESSMDLAALGYFSQIPDEITAPPARGGGMLGVIVLALLNIAALGGLIFNLVG
ncbi:MAG: hypothetical protein GYB66_04140 [Chloroflexi bacterium]|nr:hypothetical protein [Chloroflexota bacterium]